MEPLLDRTCDALEAAGASYERLGNQVSCVVGNGSHEAVVFVTCAGDVMTVWTPLGIVPDAGTVQTFTALNGSMDELAFYYAIRGLPDGREALALISKNLVPRSGQTVMGIQYLLRGIFSQLVVARELLLCDQTPVAGDE